MATSLTWDTHMSYIKIQEMHDYTQKKLKS